MEHFIFQDTAAWKRTDYVLARIFSMSGLIPSQHPEISQHIQQFFKPGSTTLKL
jgi:hypothetical protein